MSPIRRALGRRALLATPLLLAGAALAPRLAVAATLDGPALQARLAELAAGHPGRVGIGVRDLNGGAQLLVGGGVPYPMQSVYKFPIGAAALVAVDEGRLRLDQEVTVRPEDTVGFHSPLRERMAGKEARVTVAELVKLAAGDSDNTACDVLLTLLGGPGAVQAMIDGLGIRGLRVDRPERELQADVSGIPPALRPVAAAAQAEVIRAVPAEARRAAIEAYMADPRDTSTPEAMLDFIEAFHAGRLLSLESMAHLRRILTETKTGPKRLRAGLPDGWTVAHKTGTAGSFEGFAPATNDVGLLFGPEGETVAVAVFVAGSTAPEEVREGLIAEVARAVTAATAGTAPAHGAKEQKAGAPKAEERKG
ncbi:MAG TPA: class A beta-lactamase [Azospirillaceae bacterium]|nr:class A beta-lactamase [Azospirillaceae bacterium]